MTGAVVLLVTAGFLVLLENACEIILGIESCDDTRLGMGSHRLTVSVELTLTFLHERSVGHERVESLAGLTIRFVRRTGSPVGKIDLGAGNMKKALRISGGESLGLGGVNYIIRNGRDLGRVHFVRP